MVLAGVVNVVPPYNVVYADGRGKVGGVLCENGGWWWYRCEDGLLERMEAI